MHVSPYTACGTCCCEIKLSCVAVGYQDGVVVAAALQVMWQLVLCGL